MLHEKRLWRRNGKRNGFTLTEMLMTMLISFIVMGTMVMLLRYGVLLMVANLAYTAAVRGAMSSVEMLSDGIIVAQEVQIISDDKHNIEAGLEKEWRYIVLNPGGKEARHIYMGEDGVSADEKVPGSEYIEDISFDAKGGDRKGGRLLRIFIRAAYGAADERKTVDLNRTILTHAAEGVLGEWGEKAVMGRILRYRLRIPALPDLQVYGSINKDGEEVSFDYKNPHTWESLNTFEQFTELDARLTVTLQTETAAKKFKEFIETNNKAVLFAWFVVDPDHRFMSDIVGNSDAKKNPKAILEYLEGYISDKLDPDYLKDKTGWSVVDDIGAELDGEIALPDYVEKDPYNQDDNIEKARGFRLLGVTGGELNPNIKAPDTEKPNITRRRVRADVKPDSGKKFNLDIIADRYRNRHMVVVACFQTGENSAWTKTPVYVRLGDIAPSDTVFEKFVEMRAAAATELGGMTYENTKNDPGRTYGGMYLETDEKTNRRYFVLTGSSGGGTLGPFIMLKLSPEDFAHMIREGEDILYGSTNHAVYVDMSFTDISTHVGFGLYLNGSSVDIQPGNPPEYRSAGYIFHLEASANGPQLRYYGFTGSTSPTYSWFSSYWWGVRPLYFYDASKKVNAFSAPKKVRFLDKDGNPQAEDFSENAGMKGEDLYYRLPFATSNKYFDQITSDYFSAANEGRNNRYDSYFNNTYGTMNGIIETNVPYSPKYMQSWHNYPGTEIKDMIPDPDVGGSDGRKGFRWDRSWYLYTTPGGQRQLWEQRQIWKLTILEVTRNILAKEIEDEEWKYKLHHAGEIVKETDPLTKLGPDDVIHEAGDMFFRVEMIQLRKDATDWNNSAAYVYSKPIWYGKFKGDAWRGDDLSPFKKLGNSMQHIVADPEPLSSDTQSFRRRNMRVRSWKEAFLGWDFSKIDVQTRRYVWRDFLNNKKKPYNKDAPFSVEDDNGKKFPPDFFETVLNADGRVDTSASGPAHSIWTPPIAIDMNAGALTQTGAYGSGFGQYSYPGQSVGGTAGGDGVMVYDGRSYGDYIYGRLSYLRPERVTLPNRTTPIFGLYATRGWDYGTSYNSGIVADSENDSEMRFLRVVQGLQLPYQPASAGRRRERNNNPYTPERDRVFGFRFWMGVLSNKIYFYDAWIGEGFSPREVRAILGLRKDMSDEEVRDTYVGAKLEEAGFYVPFE